MGLTILYDWDSVRLMPTKDLLFCKIFQPNLVYVTLDKSTSTLVIVCMLTFIETL